MTADGAAADAVAPAGTPISTPRRPARRRAGRMPRRRGSGTHAAGCRQCAGALQRSTPSHGPAAAASRPAPAMPPAVARPASTPHSPTCGPRPPRGRAAAAGRGRSRCRGRTRACRQDERRGAAAGGPGRWPGPGRQPGDRAAAAAVVLACRGAVPCRLHRPRRRRQHHRVQRSRQRGGAAGPAGAAARSQGGRRRPGARQTASAEPRRSRPSLCCPRTTRPACGRRCRRSPRATPGWRPEWPTRAGRPPAPAASAGTTRRAAGRPADPLPGPTRVRVRVRRQRPAHRLRRDRRLRDHTGSGRDGAGHGLLRRSGEPSSGNIRPVTSVHSPGGDPAADLPLSEGRVASDRGDRGARRHRGRVRSRGLHRGALHRSGPAQAAGVRGQPVRRRADEHHRRGELSGLPRGHRRPRADGPDPHPGRAVRRRAGDRRRDRRRPDR